MERAAGFAYDDIAHAKLDKLNDLLAQSSTPLQDAALFAEMLSLPSDGRYPALELDPPQRRQKTLEALFAQVETFARKSPVLMIFEDAHWADPTSLEAFGRTVDRIGTLRILLIVTFRQDFAPPWIGQPHVTALTINRLTKREVDAMIDRVAGNKLLPADVRQDIIERTDGIPLFVEEMTKAVLEAESESAAERTVAAVPSPVLAVPATLQASLMARLDRLGTTREVAQIGAAIGREFSYELLAAVALLPSNQLADALSRLDKAGLILSRGVEKAALAVLLNRFFLPEDQRDPKVAADGEQQLQRPLKVLDQALANTGYLIGSSFTVADLNVASVLSWAKMGHMDLAAYPHLDKWLTEALRRPAAMKASGRT